MTTQQDQQTTQAAAFESAWDEYLKLRKEAVLAPSWIQDIDGVTRPSLRKQHLQERADAYWSANYELLNSLPKPISKIRESL